MAETLTIETDPNVETMGDALTSDEQESLEIGEKMVAEQEKLLAGKYKNAEELERAYAELEKKLGSEDKGEDKPEAADETTEKTEDDNPTINLITDASTEYAEKGELSQETLAEFSKMSSSDLVEAYMEMQANAPKQSTDLTDSEVNTIKNSVGGEDAYSNLVKWAGSNMDPGTAEAFDSLVDSGNAEAIKLALTGIKAQYDNANGYEGRMLSGKAPQTSKDVFRSQAELVSAMGDPRYDRDPAYRQDVIDKLERSNNLQF